MANLLKIAPSTDPCENEEQILNYVKKLKDLPDFIHCDVMSDNFVCRKTIDYKTVREIYLRTLVPLDVHLMVNEPKKLIGKYKKAGAQIITVHYEAFSDKNELIKTLKAIRKLKVLSGLSIKPSTTVEEILPYLSYADLVLVMSVEPGLSGQKFLDSTIVKIKKLKQLRDDYGARYLIEVDGGINPTNVKFLKTNGVDIVVSGSYVYNAEDKNKAIDSLK